MAHDVFISYSTRDTETALTLVKALEAAGVRCWMAPRNIKAGDVWADAIMRAIREARGFVLVFSSHANRSTHVANELDVAIGKGAAIVPFRVENVQPEGGMALHLRTIQWLDGYVADRSGPIEQLVATVKNVLGQPAQAPQTQFGPITPLPKDSPGSGSSSKGRMVSSTDSSVTFKLPKAVFLLTPKGRKYLIGALVLVGVGLWLMFRQPGIVARVPFEYRNQTSGSDFRLRFMSDTLQFFEGGAQRPSLETRLYTTKFVAAQTRYVYIRIPLIHDAPGRMVQIPISCDVLKPDGTAAGNITVNEPIQPNQVNQAWAQAWGNANPGTWRPGVYWVECRYGKTLIGRRSFEVL